MRSRSLSFSRSPSLSRSRSRSRCRCSRSFLSARSDFSLRSLRSCLSRLVSPLSWGTERHASKFCVASLIIYYPLSDLILSRVSLIYFPILRGVGNWWPVRATAKDLLPLCAVQSSNLLQWVHLHTLSVDVILSVPVRTQFGLVHPTFCFIQCHRTDLYPIACLYEVNCNEMTAPTCIDCVYVSKLTTALGF